MSSTVLDQTLAIPVTDRFTLHAGDWRQTADGDTVERIVEPPRTGMFEQVLAYLDAQPAPNRPEDTRDEAVATTAVCLRYGSYLAVLADPARPLWQVPRSRRAEAISRITNAEMARIAIEASEALARWLHIKETEPERFARLVASAMHHLPMPERTMSRTAAHRGTAVAIVGAGQIEPPDARNAAFARDPERALANALINSFWRNNNLIEDVHAGSFTPVPLLQRRITCVEERRILQAVAAGLWHQQVIGQLFDWHDGTPWLQRIEQWLTVLVSPSDWSLDEATRPVRLAGAEPALVATSRCETPIRWASDA